MTDTDNAPVKNDAVYARMLLRAATHFSERGWEYTRDHKIEHIRYARDFQGYNRLGRRVRRAMGHLFTLKKDRFWGGFHDDKPWYYRLYANALGRAASVRVDLRTDTNRPDGILAGGGVITFWEETGEYLQMVQPSVGELVANFLIEDPSHPHAVLILAELRRISDGYSDRVNAGKVDGQVRTAPTTEQDA
jgi:hypothetical protein